MNNLVLIFILFISFGAQAGIPGFEYWWTKDVNSYIELINKYESKPEPDVKCAPQYKNALAKGVLDIHYALGYFDDSNGKDVIYDNINLGISPSLDGVVFGILRKVITAPCRYGTLQNLCGFEEKGSPENGLVQFTKQITLHGQSVEARITLTQASASESFELNKSSLLDRQKMMTAQSEKNYFESIGTQADVILYNGHSRDGGGPDFNPPVLTEDLHVNYKKYYHIKKPGITRVLNLIKKSKNKDQVMAFFSCSSHHHFYKSLMRANPKQKLIMTGDLVNYIETTQVSVGYIEGFLSGACGQDLTDRAEHGEQIQKNFLNFNL